MFTPNGIRAELIYIANGQRLENVYHFTKGSPATGADLEALRAILVNWENVNAKTQRAANYSLVLVELTALDNASAPFLSSATGLPIVGTFAGAALPAFVTVAIKHSTGKSGRSFRGRTYWLGLGQGHLLNNDTVIPASAAALAAGYNTLRSNAAAGGFTFVVNSMYSGVVIVGGRRRAIPRAAGVMTAITQSTCEIGVDTNRHRKLPYTI